MITPPQVTEAVVEAERELAGAPGVDQVAPFGTRLHVVGRDPDALRAALAQVAGTTGVSAAETVTTGVTEQHTFNLSVLARAGEVLLAAADHARRPPPLTPLEPAAGAAGAGAIATAVGDGDIPGAIRRARIDALTTWKSTRWRTPAR